MGLDGYSVLYSFRQIVQICVMSEMHEEIFWKVSGNNPTDIFVIRCDACNGF